MREDWEVKKLGDVCDFQGGSQPPKSEWVKTYKDGYVRMLQIRDFTQSRNFDIEYVKITPSIKQCSSTDILIGRYGASVGKILSGLSGAYNVALMKAIPNISFIISDYIKLYFCSPSFQNRLLAICSGRAAQAGFSKDDINDFLISIPPLQTQQQIVEELDCLTSIIEKQKKQLEELDNLAQAIFYDMFGDPIKNEKGWKKKSLGTLCEVSSAKRVLVKDVVSEGIPFIRGTELAILSKQCFFDKSIFSMFITPEHYDKVKAITGVPEIGDLLIPSINPYGYVWRINTTEPIYFKDGRVLWIHTNHSIYNGDCLKHILVHEILEKYSKLPGAVFAELTLVFLRTLKIIVPPLPLQQQFASKIEAIEKQKELIKKSIKETEDLFNSRMDYYFN